MIWNYCEKLEFILKRSKNYLQRFCLMVTHPWKNTSKSLSLSLNMYFKTTEIYFWTGAEKTYVALWDKTSKINRPTTTCDKNKNCVLFEFEARFKVHVHIVTMSRSSFFFTILVFYFVAKACCDDPEVYMNAVSVTVLRCWAISICTMIFDIIELNIEQYFVLSIIT